MSSRNTKNHLKAEHGQLNFGENFHDLLPGYQSPVRYAEIDLRIISRAIENRREANRQDEEYIDYRPEAGSRQKGHFDHSLAYFERTIRRISPLVKEAIEKSQEQAENVREVRLRELQERAKSLSGDERFELDILGGLSLSDEELARSVTALALEPELDLDDGLLVELRAMLGIENPNEDETRQ